MSIDWHAEDLPAYMFDTDKRRPMTDENAAMSSPDKIAQKTDEQGARLALFGHIMLATTYRFIIASGEADLYKRAAQEILDGANAVQIHGRVYRVRDASACPNRYWHGPCETCTPESWNVYPEGWGK